MLSRFAAAMRGNLRYVMVLVFVLVFASISFAQTPVPITVDTNSIITQSNQWSTTFTPVLAIGFGISIALALITLVGTSIVNAIRNAGK